MDQDRLVRENVYTYVAESAADPDQVAVLMLHDQGLSIGPGMSLKYSRPVSPFGAQTEGALQQQSWASPWVIPLVSWLFDRGRRPFHLVDTSARVGEDSLRLTAWVRLAGLRLLPLMFRWEHVMDPAGARAFAQELERRKCMAPYPYKYHGPRNYWATWIAGAWILRSMLGRLLRLGRRRPRSEKAEEVETVITSSVE